MTCLTNIVACLRKEGIEPFAFANNENEAAANAIDGTTDKIFQSKQENSPQWWAVDFKRLVSINGYKITADAASTFNSAIYNWTLSISIDKRNWRVISYPPKRSINIVISLNNSFIGRYAKIDGNSKWIVDETVIAIKEIEFYGSHRARISAKSQEETIKKIANLCMIILLIVS